MKGFCERFAPLMAEALYCAGSPQAMELTLEEVQDRLTALVEQERGEPLSADIALAPSADPRDLRHSLTMARFAVMAWADERLLNSPRPDAAAWAARSLQLKYFRTSEGGTLFYRELEKCLDSCGIPRRVQLRTEPLEALEEKAPLPDSGEDLEALDFTLPEAEPADSGQWQDLDLAERIDMAAANLESQRGLAGEALKVFALCLLWGFKGSRYDHPKELEGLRRACGRLFPSEPKAMAPHARRRVGQSLLWLERIGWIGLPLLVTLLFALYCAGRLANGLVAP